MRTHDLVHRLAGGLTAVERNAIPKTLNRALMLGLAGSTALLVALYGFGSDMPEQLLTAMFWIRLAFPLAIIAAALKLTERLGRPGARLGLAWAAAAVSLATILLVAAGIQIATPDGYRLRLSIGHSSIATTASVVVVSLPSLAAVMHAMKRLAPTRLVPAGAGVGLLAGAQGLLVYSLYCSEVPVPFWSIWHVLAIFVTSAIGAALGPNYLRW